MRLPTTKPSMQALDGEDVVETMAYFKSKYPDADQMQIVQLTESRLARAEAKGLNRRVEALEQHSAVVDATLANYGTRIEVLEAGSAGPRRERLPSLSEARNADELAELDAQTGAPPSIVDKITRLEEAGIKQTRWSRVSPAVIAAFVTFGMAAADVIKAWILHQ